MSRTDNITLWPTGRRRQFPRNALEALRTATAARKRLVLFLVGVAWVPVFLFSSIQGFPSLKAFLLDYAAQTRLLVVIPLLLLMEQPLLGRYEAIARQFRITGLLKAGDVERAHGLFERFVNRRALLSGQFAIVLVVFLLSALTIRYIPKESFPRWGVEATLTSFSLAGYWYALVGMPIIIFLLLRWLWDMWLWSDFLRSISRMNLCLVPSHPDLMAGLSFLDTSLRGYLSLAFSIGTIFAGGAATQMLLHHQSLSSFKHAGLLVVVVVVLICVAPLCTFFGALNHARRRGTFEYGALAIRLGHEFEDKWLRRERPSHQSALEVPDFSTTADLYAVAGNVRQVKLIPVSLRSIVRLVVATSLPAIPVVLMSLPLDVLLEKITKLLL